ncbi:hypothetical protein D0Y65_036112 [Glycine soja]|uniref:FAF domain-containing protein n=2 Tax=Glycine subgen. Soja TaxID=1462606 RepID=A0A445HCW4_GLYSO|nr:hypothetical protein D0Y65_036112 [Glycine soja]
MREKERKPQEANISLPYFHGKDNVKAYLDWEIRVEQQLKRKSTSKSYGSHSYPKKDQSLGILGAAPCKPKDDKGKTIEKQPPKAMKVKKQKGKDLAKKFTPKEEGQPLMVRDECKEWRLQSSFFLLHFVAIDLQEAKDSIDEEDPWPTSFTWSYVSLQHHIFPPNNDDYIGTENYMVLQNTNNITDNHKSFRYNDARNKIKAKSKTKTKMFPPYIPLLARTQNLASHMPWVLKRYYTNEGRLILKEEKMKHHEYFRAHRANGRLTLHLVNVPFDGHNEYFEEATPSNTPHDEEVHYHTNIVTSNDRFDEVEENMASC